MKSIIPKCKWHGFTAYLSACASLTLVFSLPLQAQGAGTPATPADARAQAPQDLTGYWVSLVTEDWRFRMLVADPGDTESVPLNPVGIKAAKAWNPQQAKTDGADACKAFGAAGLMRIPGRVHITWQDGTTLKVQTDSGTQTRLFHFGGNALAGEPPSWQGYSVASWQGMAPRGPFGRGPVAGQKEGYLQVITTDLRPGYLRTNGVPYSGHTRLLEDYDTFAERGGDRYLVITTIVHDPAYLTQPFVTSTHFKKLPDGSGWDPTVCRGDEPR